MPPTPRGKAISLSSHLLVIKKRPDPDALLLGEFDGHTSAYDVMLRALRHMQDEPVRDDEVQSVFRISRVEAFPEKHLLLFQAETGDFGYGAELVDVEQRFEPVYRRETTHAELIPLFGLLYLPPDKKEGIVILQRFGVRGMINAFVGAVRQFFGEAYGDYHVDIDPHVPREVVEALHNGQVRRIQLTARRIPADLAARLRLPQGVDDIGGYQVEIKAKRNQFLERPDWMATLMDGRIRSYTMPEEVARDFERIRVRVQYNGRERMVELGDFGGMRPYIDVSAEVRRGSQGHPEYESVREHAEGLLADLLVELGHEVAT